MKIKISCRPQQSLWFKKIISNILVIGLLFNSGISSFAGVLSEDGRYETFEGNNIIVDNVLEEDKVDVEIEGNTLVNFSHVKSYTAGRDGSSNGNHMLVPGKTYTFYCEITDVSDDNVSGPFMRVNFNNFTSFLSVIDQKYEIGEYIKTFTIPSNKTIDNFYVGWIRNYQDGQFATMDNIMILEGEYDLSTIPDYFEGMKSVGELEDNKLNIEALGENLFDVEYFKEMIETHYDEGNYGYEVKDGRNTVWVVNDHGKLWDKNMISNNYKLKENTQYIIKGNVFLDENNPTTSNGLRGKVTYTDGTAEAVLLCNSKNKWISTNKVTDNSKNVKSLVFIHGDKTSKAWIDLDSLYIAEYNPDKTEFNYDYNVQNLEIDLKEPLRGLPNGVKDRIIKINGQWVIERNLGEIVLDGSDDEIFKDNGTSSGNFITYYIPSLSSVIKSKSKILSNTLSSIQYNLTTDINFDKMQLFTISYNNNLFFTYDISKGKPVKKWLQENPTNIIYELNNPIYEPLNISPIINLYLDTTHISNNSTIPANMKVTVDRTINRATEAIELAKTNPTVDNLSKARMWINLLDNSLIKDELQEEINDITQIEDLTIEPKKVSSNLDIYVKSKNSLIMTLSTNSIIFDNFTGVDDMEKLNAVNLTVNSSLPYQLNSYMMTELKNNDNTKVIPKELLNIRLNGETEYKAFNNINEKLVLKEDCEKGNNNQFNIDLILKGSLTHKADVYKTTIKFEAEQK